MRQKALAAARAEGARGADAGVWSMLLITDSIVSTASGISACTMPIIVPVKL